MAERERAAIPGPKSQQVAAVIAAFEAPGVTYLGADYPIAWESAAGSVVIDADGNRYLDLTGAFGVAAVGHTNAAVVTAVREQAGRLLHGMGDVHPTGVKARLLERLAAVAPGDCSQTYLGCNGADAIEYARKTALLATGKAGAVAYRGAYHGLSLGSLPWGGIDRFREPFAPLLGAPVRWLPYPRHDVPLAAPLGQAAEALAGGDIGAVVVEPVLGRGGVVVPPAGFLRGLRRLCDEAGALLVVDEIYTGFGRTGTMFACEREAVVPDVLCVGKAIAGGLPLSAAIGRPAVLAAWPPSEGEALHTATFLGNPLACAAALAVLDEFERRPLLADVRRREPLFRCRLERLLRHAGTRAVRGLGALWAVEYDGAERANRIVRTGLQRGLILLQSGVDGSSITLAPPLVIEDAQLEHALDVLDEITEHA